MRSTRLVPFLALLIVTSLSAIAQSAPTEGQRKQINDARSKYYQLTSHGFKGFECEVTASGLRDADSMLAASGGGPTADSARNVIAGLRMTIAVAEDGKATFSSTPLALIGNSMIDDGLRQIVAGLKQTTEGFFSTWSHYILESPLPAENHAYRLEKIKDGFRILPPMDANTVLTTNKEFQVRETAVKYDGVNVKIRPKFEQTPEGWLVNHLEIIDGGGTKTTVAIAYSMQNGMRIPTTLKAVVTPKKGDKVSMTIEFRNIRTL